MPLDPAAVLTLALPLLVAGLLGGVLAGLLGVGGGIVIVPILFNLFTATDIAEAVRMHLAVGTSLSTIVVTSIASARAHHHRGSLDARLFRAWAPWIALGVVVGTIAAGYASADALKRVFGVIALGVAGYMAFVPAGVALAEKPPEGVLRGALGIGIGGFSTLMGIGGGSLTVPVLVLSSVPVRRAVGTSAAIGLIIAVPGSIGFAVAGWGRPDLPPFSLGYVNLLGFALIVPLTVWTAPIGARIANTIDTRWLKAAFAAFLALTSVRMLFDL